MVMVMDHTSKHGDSKVLRACTLPLTGKGVVDRIITNLGVLDVGDKGLHIVELAHGVTEAALCAATEAQIVNEGGQSRSGRCQAAPARSAVHHREYVGCRVRIARVADPFIVNLRAA